MNFHRKKPYHLSIEDIETFIYYTRKSIYHIDQITLIGGEPLLWKHIKLGLQMFKTEFPTTRIKIITNGLLMVDENLEDLIKIARRVDVFRISWYAGNDDNIAFALKHFFDKIHIADNRIRLVVPDDLNINDTTPVICKCPGYTISGSIINFCSPIRTMGFLYPERSPINLQTFYNPLIVNYLDLFEDIKPESWWLACKRCIANASIRQYCQKVVNVVK